MTSLITSFGVNIKWSGKDIIRWVVNFHSTGVRIEWNSRNEWNIFTPQMEWIIHSTFFESIQCNKEAEQKNETWINFSQDFSGLVLANGIWKFKIHCHITGICDSLMSSSMFSVFLLKESNFYNFLQCWYIIIFVHTTVYIEPILSLYYFLTALLIKNPSIKINHLWLQMSYVLLI